MRRISYLSEDRKVQEAFKAGSSASVAEKMYRILSRKVGKSFVFSSYPTEYSNKEGKFLGYYATMGNTLVRINFLLQKSDNVHSVDVFGKNPRKPDTTLHLMGFNIVQIIDQIVDYFTGDFFRYDESVSTKSKRLKEALKHSELIKMWIENEGNDQLPEDVSKQRVNIETEYQKFTEFCQDQGRKEPKHSGAFLWLISNYVKTEMGGSFKIPSIEVFSGQVEDPINTDQQASTAYDNILDNEHLLKFKVLEYYVSRVAAGDDTFSGVYVYGDGGIGKSYLAKKYLEPLPETFYMTGKVKGYLGFAKLLYNHRDDEIIVMDDSITKEDMKNSAIENILKAALDPESPRRIIIQSAQESSVSTTRDGVAISLNENEFKEYTKEILKENTDIVDFTSNEGMDSTTDFSFNSKMVFLTNYPQVPQALQDRCWALEMIFSNEQVMDIIETNIEKISPNLVPEAHELFDMLGVATLTDEDKREVINFMKTSDASGLTKRKFSIRVYKRLLSLYAATKHTPMWKHFLLMELKA